MIGVISKMSSQMPLDRQKIYCRLKLMANRKKPFHQDPQRLSILKFYVGPKALLLRSFKTFPVHPASYQ